MGRSDRPAVCFSRLRGTRTGGGMHHWLLARTAFPEPVRVRCSHALPDHAGAQRGHRFSRRVADRQRQRHCPKPNASVRCHADRGLLVFHRRHRLRGMAAHPGHSAGHERAGNRLPTQLCGLLQNHRHPPGAGGRHDRAVCSHGPLRAGRPCKARAESPPSHLDSTNPRRRPWKRTLPNYRSP